MELAKRHAICLVLFGLTNCTEIDPDLPDCTKFRCDEEALVYTPAPELMAAAEDGLARFAAATGRADLSIAKGGVPIIFTEDLVDPLDGHVACAITVAVYAGNGPYFTQRIEIDPTPPELCPAWNVSLMHELIHALAPHSEHSANEASLFAPQIPSGVRSIDESALLALCSEFDCHAFAPETTP